MILVNMGTAHSDLGPPTSIKKIYHRLTHKPIWGDIFSTRVPSSQMTLGCQADIQLAKDTCLLADGRMDTCLGTSNQV